MISSHIRSPLRLPGLQSDEDDDWAEGMAAGTRGETADEAETRRNRVEAEELSKKFTGQGSGSATMRLISDLQQVGKVQGESGGCGRGWVLVLGVGCWLLVVGCWVLVLLLGGLLCRCDCLPTCTNSSLMTSHPTGRGGIFEHVHSR
jgi:hypothetical protein